MLSSKPLTAAIDIQKATIVHEPLIEAKNKKEHNTKLGEFADVILNISALAHDKQQKEVQVETSQQINDIANDVIKVSSSIGRARILGNLTNSQASNLYNKIASLL